VEKMRRSHQYPLKLHGFSLATARRVPRKKQTITHPAKVIRYIQVCSEEEIDRMDFWQKHPKIFPRLYLVSMKLLAVPATSAPVERVFSHGGLIMRPHRARLSAKTLSSLIFLKCNHSVA